MPAGCLELPQRLLRRQRKSGLVRQLKRKAVSDDGCAVISATAPAVRAAEDRRSARRKGLLDALLKRLDLEQLEALGAAVRSEGATRTGCVLVDRDVVAVVAPDGRAASDPSWLCCRAWRWPELPERAALRPLPLCSPPPDRSSCCVNPYHWSRVMQCPDNLPVSRCEQDIDDLADSGFCGSGGSACLDTPSSTNSWIQRQQHLDGWCQVAYWELSQRIGPLLRVAASSIDIFHDSPQHGCGGLSLQALWEAASQQQQATAAHGVAQHGCTTDEWQQQQLDDGGSGCGGSSRLNQLRTKIGLGVSLQRADDGAVWVHNRSDIAAFVSSCFLDLVCTGTDRSSGRGKDCATVLKLLPGCCIKVDDGAALQGSSHSGAKARAPFEGPTDPRSVHLSFAKGWGPGYTRQSITGCSCWLEILLPAEQHGAYRANSWTEQQVV